MFPGRLTVGKRPSMHEHGRVLERLHQGRHDGILHQHTESAAHAQVVCGDRLPGPACSAERGRGVGRDITLKETIAVEAAELRAF